MRLKHHRSVLVVVWQTRGAPRYTRNGRQSEYSFSRVRAWASNEVGQVAHSLGINRLGPELHKAATYHDVLNHFGRKWVMASDREVGRRIWWTLVRFRVRVDEVPWLTRRRSSSIGIHPRIISLIISRPRTCHPVPSRRTSMMRVWSATVPLFRCHWMSIR